MFDKVIDFFNSLPNGKKYLVVNGLIFGGIFLLGSIPMVTTILCAAGVLANLYAAFVDIE